VIPIPSSYRTYLLAHGASDTPHSGYTLWDHLAGVQLILQMSGAADYVQAAGLFHSVYGTNAFKTVTVSASRRGEVQNLIGLDAESLVWAFCNLPRPQIFEKSLQGGKSFDWLEPFAPKDQQPRSYEDLLRLECANLLEQKILYQFPRLAKMACQYGMLDEDGFAVTSLLGTNLINLGG
jgi:hypothetical protein